MKHRAILFAALPLAILLGAASPYPTAQPRGPQTPAEAKAYAEQLRRAWIETHPGDTSAVTKAPKILSGTITTPTVDIQASSAAPGVQVKFATDASGLADINVAFSGPGGETISAYYNSGNFPVSGTLTLLNNSLNPFTESGTFTLQSVEILSNDGGYSFYTGGQIPALFTNDSFQVTNTNPGDITPPRISAGKIKTPTVSLSSAKPAFEATVLVSDDVSGVSSLILLIMDPTGNVHFTSGFIASPIVAPTRIPIGLYLGNTIPAALTGTWTIALIQVMDRAGNVSLTSASSVFGSGSFVVTN